MTTEPPSLPDAEADGGEAPGRQPPEAPPVGGPVPLAPPTPVQADLIRQGERSVDNLKRLFAFVFSLSFAFIGVGAIEKLKPVLIGQKLPPNLSVWFLNAEMLTIFIITAGVFFHQSAKYLDNRYARHPLTSARPYGFALDYITQVFTAAPFYFMAFAYNPLVTNAVGYIWFFGFYIVLLASGLILLFLAMLRHGAPVAFLHTYWFLMNSAMLVIILALFQGFVWFVSPCPTSPTRGSSVPVFLFLFGGLALVRDLLDYRFAWRFVYPIDPVTAEALDPPLMRRIRDSQGWRTASTWAGILFVVISLFLIGVTLRLWDFAYWTTVCKVAQ